MTARRPRVVVGLSGGVDSAVAALLMQREGFDVVAVFMKNWEEDDTASHCSAAEDFKMAQAVCAHLQIPLQAVNFSTEYWDRVFSFFLAEHRAGRTPNPDVLCNSEIKFKAFLDHALVLGAEHLATGHYARVEKSGGRCRLLKGVDDNKDQSYFLHTLGQHALDHTLFPIGDLTKPEVRAIARDAGLPNHNRKDSTGICFIGERNYKAFLKRYLPDRPGDIRTLDGEWKGRHDGLTYYTLGQRHGLGVGGPGDAWYVVAKDTTTHTLIVGQGDNHPALFSSALMATAWRWTAGQAPAMTRLSAKTRYRQADQACRLEPIIDGEMRVVFDEPQRAITPGQSVVLYDGNECLGGGIIQASVTTAVAPPLCSTTP